MYNPSRGGVRGGADQFTWESVKSDKHRENYLGHSLKAPVGRWQKGKDLSWYSKERKDGEEANKSEKNELAEIKRAEEEAMLIALGQNVTRKESQPLSNEEMKEALKRNTVERDSLNIERVDGVGAGRRNLLVGISSRTPNEGITFETSRKRGESTENQREIMPAKRSKNKEKSKKHKSEKKCKKSHKYCDSDDSEPHKKHKTKNDAPLKRKKSYKKAKQKHRTNSGSSESDHQKRCKGKKHGKDRTKKGNNHSKNRRHDTSESD